MEQTAISVPVTNRLTATSIAAAGSLTVAAAFVLVARARTPGPLWTLANALTLSRGVAAAGLAADAVNRRRRRATWIALVIGCTLTDWLDGPVARRRGPTRLGAILDLEADSWLTLWAAVAAWRSRALPAWCLAPPVLRYPVRVLCAAHRRMGARPWQRAAGAVQMCVFCAALAPWKRARAASRRLVGLSAAVQLAALAAEFRAQATR